MRGCVYNNNIMFFWFYWIIGISCISSPENLEPRNAWPSKRCSFQKMWTWRCRLWTRKCCMCCMQFQRCALRSATQMVSKEGEIIDFAGHSKWHSKPTQHLTLIRHRYGELPKNQDKYSDFCPSQVSPVHTTGKNVENSENSVWQMYSRYTEYTVLIHTRFSRSENSLFSSWHNSGGDLDDRSGKSDAGSPSGGAAFKSVNDVEIC